MSQNFASQNGLAMPNGGLSQRRGGSNVKPLSMDALRQQGSPSADVSTPRTSRSHLLAGLRTAPRSATVTAFDSSNNSGTGGPTQHYARSSMSSNGRNGQDMYNGPKTAFPQYGSQNNNMQSMMAQQAQQRHQQPYTVDQILAPPEMAVEQNVQEQMDPTMYNQLVATNMYLAQQQQRLQQQLRNLQVAAQQFQQLSINNPSLAQQQMALYEQQQQLRNAQLQQQQMQMQMQAQSAASGYKVYYNPADGQYYMETPATQQVSTPYNELPTQSYVDNYLQNQQQQQQYQQHGGTPRVQVSPPPENQSAGTRSTSPPKGFDSPAEVAPLPPPSSNAFRRGHKKSSSLAPINSTLATGNGGDGPKTAGPKSAFPMTPNTGGYGPGQARAGEHPVRQPRGPPGIEELKAKPTAKHEGSKNFAARTRRSAVHNLVRAGLERRKGTGSSTGSMSPVSETAEESSTPITDNESDSGRSGSGSLAGDAECTSSRTSASGSWGAIGSDRPSSRQKARHGDSNVTTPLADDASNNSFANVFKNGALRAAKEQENADQRKAARLVLTSAEKRRAYPAAWSVGTQ